MADQTLKDLRGNSRRRFLKFAGAAGAALALQRSDVLNVISDVGGEAMAQDLSCSETNRSIHLVAGRGGFAWFQLLFPHTEIAQAGDAGFAYHTSPANSPEAADTDHPFVFAPETPWQQMGPTKRITAMMSGSNETHTEQPTTAATMGGNISMLAAIARLQNQLPSLLPVIGVTPFSFGTAPGAPAVTTVGSPMGMVDLFNSSASQALLSVPDDAAQYEAYYKAFLSLNRAARRPTYAGQLRITKASANFLGKNLADLLRPSDADRVAFGIDGNPPTNLRELGEGLIIATRALKLGLTNSIILPALRDDPHGAFGNMGDLNMRVAMLGKMLDATYEVLNAIPDPSCSGQSLGSTTIMTIHGDTPKNPRNRNGWPDGTPNNSNWLYVMGNGYLKTGWFGGVRANGNVDGFDPKTGDNVAGQASAATATAAGAAAAFAVAKGDQKRVDDVLGANSVNIAGIVNPQLL
ncbi:MAG TPA: twin-arginine translocation signal domain-containing protein [Sorangium sp.]|nr:twin-arginine translocation signal domain-containing protein [Sorangium sp.]